MLGSRLGSYNSTLNAFAMEVHNDGDAFAMEVLERWESWAGHPPKHLMQQFLTQGVIKLYMSKTQDSSLSIMLKTKLFGELSMGKCEV